MKDFDIEREQRAGVPVEERTFKLGGETFVMRDGVRPEVLANLDALRDATLDQRTCSCGHPRQAHGPGATRACEHQAQCGCEKFSPAILDAGATLTERIKALDSTFKQMIETAEFAYDRYDEIRSREVDPIRFPDLGSVIEWMVEEQTRKRPTGSRSASTALRETSGMTSMDSSSSLASPAESAV